MYLIIEEEKQIITSAAKFTRKGSMLDRYHEEVCRNVLNQFFSLRFLFQLKSRVCITYLEVVNFVLGVIHVDICFEAVAWSKNICFSAKLFLQNPSKIF